MNLDLVEKLCFNSTVNKKKGIKTIFTWSALLFMARPINSSIADLNTALFGSGSVLTIAYIFLSFNNKKYFFCSGSVSILLLSLKRENNNTNYKIIKMIIAKSTYF